MAQVILCDRCERMVHLPMGEPGGCDRIRPMEVRLPELVEDAALDFMRVAMPVELCEGCLDSLMSWFKRRDAKE